MRAAVNWAAGAIAIGWMCSGCKGTDPLREWQSERVEIYLTETESYLDAMSEHLQFLSKDRSRAAELAAPVRREHLGGMASLVAGQEARTRRVAGDIRSFRPDVRSAVASELADRAGLKSQREWLGSTKFREILREAEAEAPLRRIVEELEHLIRLERPMEPSK